MIAYFPHRRIFLLSISYHIETSSSRHSFHWLWCDDLLVIDVISFCHWSILSFQIPSLLFIPNIHLLSRLLIKFHIDTLYLCRYKNTKWWTYTQSNLKVIVRHKDKISSMNETQSLISSDHLILVSLKCRFRKNISWLRHSNVQLISTKNHAQSLNPVDGFHWNTVTYRMQ